jgi:lipopolysaccharide assembly outer membrane protein LptD (OstA)
MSFARGSLYLKNKSSWVKMKVVNGTSQRLSGLVAAFYETDNGVLGFAIYVGDVFRYDAKELFVKYATRCTDKEKVAAIISAASAI